MMTTEKISTRGFGLKTLIGVSAILLANLTFAASEADLRLQPQPEHKQVQRSIVQNLSKKHYIKYEVDDTLSGRLLDSYLAALDPSRMYFTAIDVESFERYRYILDNALNNTDLSPAYEIFRVFRDNQKKRFNYLLGKIEIGLDQLDFSRDEHFDFDRKESPWPADEEALDELWHKRLKINVLDNILKDEELAEIASTLTKRYQNRLRRIGQISSEDVFQIYMNALTKLYDPHTEYFSPRTSENFNIHMSLSLEGIGALLRLEEEYTTVVRLIPAGPADKAGELQPDDKILAVGQNVDGEMVDVIGWRLDDVVELIRGPKGTVVKLEVRSGSESDTNIIQITRNTVKLEEQSVKSHILEINHDGQKSQIGTIKIPIFYSDFNKLRDGDPNYKSTTRDTKKILDELKTKDLAGIIIDLRGNGGGSLQEANSLTGLFISSGPTVQVRHANNKVNVFSDTNSAVVYEGPMMVLINRLSASASEIFAGAIQDYGRGLILGTQSYGKGTVQILAPLPQGQLKTTQAKFYRISGQSTQHTGITPDIKFPAIYDPKYIGESTLDNALVWDSIRRARYREYNYFDAKLPALIAKHQVRASTNPELVYLKNMFVRNRAQQTETSISLNEEQRKQENEEDEKWRITQENNRRIQQCLSPISTLEQLDDLPEKEERVEGCSVDKFEGMTLFTELKLPGVETDTPVDPPVVTPAVESAHAEMQPEEAGAEGEASSEKPVNIDTVDPLLVESGRILLDFIQPEKRGPITKATGALKTDTKSSAVGI